MVITTPGFYDVKAKDYHADPVEKPSLSSSIAKILIDQSPAHAWMAHPRLNLGHQRETDSRSDLGSAAHAMLLEPSRDPVVVRVPFKDWRTNAAKEARELAYSRDKFPVLEDKYADIQNMVLEARAFLDKTELAGILGSSLNETTVVWNDAGIWCRSRPDSMSIDRTILLDYKTTTDASPEAIAKQIGRMGYDVQAEFYTRGQEILMGHPATFVFLFQEITPPYACSLISLSAAYREVGKLKVQRAMQLWERAINTNTWAAYSHQILYAEPKPWDLARAEELDGDDE